LPDLLTMLAAGDFTARALAGVKETSEALWLSGGRVDQSAAGLGSAGCHAFVVVLAGWAVAEAAWQAVDEVVLGAVVRSPTFFGGVVGAGAGDLPKIGSHPLNAAIVVCAHLADWLRVHRVLTKITATIDKRLYH
jgi:hypothetical protein